MSNAETVPLGRQRLCATDERRVPMLGVALGIAIAATILGLMERGTFATVAVAVMWIVVVLVVLSVMPVANTLTLDRDGFRIRVLGAYSHFVPWSAVRSIDTGEGWAGATLIIELAPEADAATIFGMPYDATLGRRTFVDSYGCAPQELARLMEIHRVAAHP